MADLVARAGHRFVPLAVDRLDPRARTLVTSDSAEHRFDACILAVGGVHTTNGVPGAITHALAFKSVADCAAIGRRLQQAARRQGPLQVVVVGGGLEGVEAVGEVLRAHRDRPGLHVSLVELGPRLLGEFGGSLDHQVRRACKDQPVRLYTGRRVTEVVEDGVWLDDGTRLDSALTIWTGGAAPHPLLAQAGLAKPGSWAPVRRTLQSEMFDHVFVVGDAAQFPQPLPKQAGHALDMGAHAGDNLQRLLSGRRLRPFRPSPRPTLVSFGDLDGFTVAAGRSLSGRAANLGKEVILQAGLGLLDRGPTSILRTGSRLRTAS